MSQRYPDVILETIRRRAEEAQRAQAFYSTDIDYNRAPTPPDHVPPEQVDAYWAGEIQSLERGDFRRALSPPTKRQDRKPTQYQPSIETVSPKDVGDLKKGKKLYEDWHWGIQPSRFIDWDDPDYPETLIECGRLVRIHFRAPRLNGSVHPRRERDRMIEFSRDIANNSHLTYDPAQTDQRLYLLLSPEATPTVAERFWKNNALPPQPLSQLALLAGGRHGKRGDYPNVLVKPVGITTALVYYTHKKSDGPSYYIHRLGEESCHYPILAVDSLGRLWLAGGNYRAPTEGITD